MANRALLSALNTFHEAATCPCTEDNLCPGCLAKNDQLGEFMPQYLHDQLGDLRKEPARLCQFFAVISTAHDQMHTEGHV